MKFNELDSKMRVFETLNDHYVLPNVYMVARIDGRGFTKLTKDKHDFERPFDIKFRDLMIETTRHLMDSGFRIVYGYTQSDEISLLFHIDENTFNRKQCKLNSILAGEASSKFSLLLNDLAAFDSRLSILPSKNLVVDYFRWRNEDAHRNSLNAHCYWLLRKSNYTAAAAANEIKGLTMAEKNELLFIKGKINFNDLPQWQKRGIGLYWVSKEVFGHNPKTNESVKTIRRKLFIDYELKMKDEYGAFILNLIDE